MCKVGKESASRWISFHPPESDIDCVPDKRIVDLNHLIAYKLYPSYLLNAQSPFFGYFISFPIAYDADDGGSLAVCLSPRWMMMAGAWVKSALKSFQCCYWPLKL